ncbi:cytochrome P450 9b2 [Bactrocera neohumeralis]|uniref:cytochrome P450 9b2 n=1 Tax=Bactrocera neohumeralis TaxID=98809 RepID=UPI0021658DDC|nr:cytochrome P450 9b2 [Bactrocera neohumeralis]
MVFIELGLVSLLLLYIFYKWATFKYNTFKERGVPYEEPWPLVGNAGAVVLNREGFNKTVLKFYQRNKDHDIVGFYNFRSPVFVVQNPDYIKKMTVKDFDFFVNHTPFFKADDDPLINGMLTVMKDQRWKNMRNTLSPIFTAAKMRAMFSLMNECLNECLGRLRDATKGGKSHDIELKGWFTRLSNDIIASTAFGLKINSYEDKNNEFYMIGQSISNFRGKQMLKFFVSNTMPIVQKILGYKIFDTDKTDYFKRLVIDTMKYRQENKIHRPDMIQLLIEAKQESDQNWSDDDIVAQCFIFFFAAFENNANFTSVICHELMENPEVQERLYEEALEVREELNGKPLTYEAVMKMKYMDMVTSETLRKWNLAGFTDRLCSKDYDLTDDDGNLVFKFKTDDYVWFPIIGLHYNEKYFEDPDAFNPERFSDENKDNIKPFTYLPFGVGPRMCIGNRYALMQAKAMMYYMILDFKLVRSPKTVKNIMDDIRGFQINPMGGFWVRLIPRA